MITYFTPFNQIPFSISKPLATDTISSTRRAKAKYDPSRGRSIKNSVYCYYSRIVPFLAMGVSPVSSLSISTHYYQHHLLLFSHVVLFSHIAILQSKALKETKEKEKQKEKDAIFPFFKLYFLWYTQNPKEYKSAPPLSSRTLILISHSSSMSSLKGFPSSQWIRQPEN